MIIIHTSCSFCLLLVLQIKFRDNTCEHFCHLQTHNRLCKVRASFDVVYVTVRNGHPRLTKLSICVKICTPFYCVTFTQRTHHIWNSLNKINLIKMDNKQLLIQNIKKTKTNCLKYLLSKSN